MSLASREEPLAFTCQLFRHWVRLPASETKQKGETSLPSFSSSPCGLGTRIILESPAENNMHSLTVHRSCSSGTPGYFTTHRPYPALHCDQQKKCHLWPDPFRDSASGPGHSSLTWPRAAVVVLCGVVTCDMWCCAPFHISVCGSVLLNVSSMWPQGVRHGLGYPNRHVPLLPYSPHPLRVLGTELINNRLER
jgi:hypothetical protein